jgi:hypothetical protein
MVPPARHAFNSPSGRKQGDAKAVCGSGARRAPRSPGSGALSFQGLGGASDPPGKGLRGLTASNSETVADQLIGGMQVEHQRWSTAEIQRLSEW